MNIIGTVSHLVGQVFAIKADGSERLLALGDPVFSDEMVRVAPGGAIEISMDSGELVKLEGGQNWLATTETYQEAGDFDLSEATADIQSIQEAILAGVDPTEVTEATAAGGEPAAGAEGDEGSSTVVVNRTAEEVDPTAGYDTIGFQDTFEQPEEELLFTPEAPDEPVVSVSVQVEVQVDVTTEVDFEDPDSENPFEETGENVVLSPQGVLVLEGTESGEDTETRDITFNLVLDKVFDQDVQVTYQLRPVSTDGSADYPEDWYDLTLDPITVTIPAGTVSLPVVVTIVQDHVDEANGQFEIVLLSAENATINPDANSEQIFIIDDDTTPVAQDDFNSVMEDAYPVTDEQYPDSGYPSTEGNVIAGEHDDSDFSPTSQADTDEDGDALIVVSFGDADETAAPGATITGEYGTLTLNEDGSYQYILTSNNEDDIQGLSEGETLEDVFSYVVTDTYNENQSATLTITIEGKDDGVSITGLSSEGAEEFVSEVNLSDGSAPNTGALTQGGSFSFEAKDGLDTVSIGGQNFNLSALSALDGTQTVAMSFGTLVLTGYVGDAFGGTISYEYTLNDNVDNDSQAGADGFGFTDSIAVVVTDEDGSSDNETLDVFIADDIPAAEADSDSVTEGLGNSVNGNVLTNDEGGADLLDSSTVSWSGSLVGTYGTLSDDGAGNWTYTLTAASVPPGATDSFDYTVEDSDGDITGETLTISIDQDTNIPNVVGDAQTVYEDGLADGVQHGGDSETTAGSFTVDANGEDYTLTLNADTISAVGDTVDTGTGILTITGINQVGDVVTYDYSYTLSAPLTHADGSGENALTDTISMSVTDATGDSDATPGSLVITLTDDIPVAEADSDNVTEGLGNSVNGNVLTNDEGGADLLDSSTVSWSGSLVGTYGTLSDDGAGNWTYTLTAASVPPGATDSFDYTVEDSDGDITGETLTISIDQDTNIPNVVGDAQTVYEDGLADGVQHGGDSETTAGSFTVDANGEDYTLTLNADTISAVGDTVDTGTGILTITGINQVGNVVTYDYSYTLSAPLTHADGSGENALTDTISMSVTDATGDSDATPGSLVITLTDDIPVAEADSDNVTEGLGNSVNGNVLTNDEGGADLLDSSTVSWSGSLVGTYGTLSDDGAGNWTYTLTAASVPPGATDSFDYTVEDSDGDITGETLTISIDQDTNIPNVVGDAQTVYEDGLADGVQHGGDSETTAGSFTVDANGEDYTLTLNADTISAVGDTVDTGTGILTITGINQVGDVVTYDYSYTLSAPLTHADGSGENALTDTISMSVTDATGDSDATPGNIVVTIVDDVPVITSSQNSIMTNVVGNEVTGAFNISYGADGPGSLSVALTAMLVTTDGAAVTLTQTDVNTWLGHTGTYGVDQGPVFELSIDPVDQTYTFDLLGPDLIAAFEQKQAGQGSSFGSGPADAYIIPDAVDPSVDLVLISGYEIGDLSDFDLTTADFDDIHSDDNTVFADVNLQNNYYGVDTPAVGVDQALVMDFTGDNFGYTLPGEFDGPIVTSITIGIQKSATISWVAYNDAGEVITSDTDLAVVKNQSIVISGENNEFISYVVVYGETGATGVVVQSVGTLSNTGITDVTFDVTATDSDGDVTLPAEISVTVDGSGDIRGTDAGEVISGASGNNILTGGLGDDIFLFTAEDQGTVGTPDFDKINDFNDNGEADVLDLSDLLVGEEGTDLTAFLAVSEDAGAVVIDVNPDGLSGNTEQIRLEGTTLADLGANALDTQVDIISDLITNGHIQVDDA